MGLYDVVQIPEHRCACGVTAPAEAQVHFTVGKYKSGDLAWQDKEMVVGELVPDFPTMAVLELVDQVWCLTRECGRPTNYVFRFERGVLVRARPYVEGEALTGLPANPRKEARRKAASQEELARETFAAYGTRTPNLAQIIGLGIRRSLGYESCARHLSPHAARHAARRPVRPHRRPLAPRGMTELRFEVRVQIHLTCCGQEMVLKGNLALRGPADRTELGYECARCHQQVAVADAWPKMSAETQAEQDLVE